MRDTAGFIGVPYLAVSAAAKWSVHRFRRAASPGNAGPRLSGHPFLPYLPGLREHGNVPRLELAAPDADPRAGILCTEGILRLSPGQIPRPRVLHREVRRISALVVTGSAADGMLRAFGFARAMAGWTGRTDAEGGAK
jgi:hypothetical protein